MVCTLKLWRVGLILNIKYLRLRGTLEASCSSSITVLPTFFPHHPGRLRLAGGQAEADRANLRLHIIIAIPRTPTGLLKESDDEMQGHKK